MRIENPVSAQVLTARPSPTDPGFSKNDLVDRIRARGVLRVGVDVPTVPFAFYNLEQELVGYDVARAHSLAQMLGCRLEFVPLNPATLAQDLDRGVFDLAMSRISIQPDKLNVMAFSDPYLTLHAGLVVKDYRETEFSSIQAIRQIKNLRIAVPAGALDASKIANYFPQAQIVPVQHADDFFLNENADALWTTAEEGSAWSLLYPAYSVVVPSPGISQELLGYAIAKNNSEMLDVLHLWLTLAKENGTAQKLYDYWILGKQTSPVYHWSVIRDVLHWVE